MSIGYSDQVIEILKFSALILSFLIFLYKHFYALTRNIFRYDLNPITVRYHEDRPPLYHFLTTICAIVGGTFTVAGIIDSCIFSATEILKKFELGKLS